MRKSITFVIYHTDIEPNTGSHHNILHLQCLTGKADKMQISYHFEEIYWSIDNIKSKAIFTSFTCDLP